MKWNSFLSEIFNQYEFYRKASERWDEPSSTPQYLHLFDKFIISNYPTATILTQEMVDDWCSQRDTETNNSCRARIYPTIMFLKYSIERNLVMINLPLLPKQQPQTSIPHSFTDEELSRFFKACDKYPFNYRHPKSSKILQMSLPVIFRLLFSSGIRTTELRKLERKDVDIKNGILNICKSKGHDQHYVALHDTMLNLMRKYDISINKYSPNRKYFFQSFMGNVYSRSSLAYYFRRIWNTCNPSCGAIPYSLRHHFAVVNINSWSGGEMESQVKLSYLAKVMGHKQMQSTVYYYSITPGLSDIIKELTEEDFNNIIPDVSYEKESE